MRTSRVIAAAAVVLASGALAGCEKPAPGVTVFSGTNSVRTSALCWSFSGEPLAAEECTAQITAGVTPESAPDLRVRGGNTVGISVDPVIAEAGWVPTIGGQRLIEGTLTETYFRFTFPATEVPDEGYGLEIVAGQGEDLKGVWAVRLVG